MIGLLHEVVTKSTILATSQQYVFTTLITEWLIIVNYVPAYVSPIDLSFTGITHCVELDYQHQPS